MFDITIAHIKNFFDINVKMKLKGTNLFLFSIYVHVDDF